MVMIKLANSIIVAYVSTAWGSGLENAQKLPQNKLRHDLCKHLSMDALGSKSSHMPNRCYEHLVYGPESTVLSNRTRECVIW